jgi:hypothetical protein
VTATPPSVVDSLRGICQLITSGPHSAIDVAKRLGGVKLDRGSGFQVEVLVSNPLFKAARVIREADEQTAASIELELHQAISVVALQAALGPYRESNRPHWDSPIKISFSVDKEDPTKACKIFGAIEPGFPSIAEGQVRRFSIRPL